MKSLSLLFLILVGAQTVSAVEIARTAPKFCRTMVLFPNAGSKQSPFISAETLWSFINSGQSSQENANKMRGHLQNDCVTCDQIEFDGGPDKAYCLRTLQGRMEKLMDQKHFMSMFDYHRSLLLNQVALLRTEVGVPPEWSQYYKPFQYSFFKAPEQPFTKGRVVENVSYERWFSEPNRSELFYDNVFKDFPGSFDDYFATLHPSDRRLAYPFLKEKLLSGVPIVASAFMFTYQNISDLVKQDTDIIGTALKNGKVPGSAVFWLSYVYAKHRIEKIQVGILAEQEILSVRTQLMRGKNQVRIKPEILKSLSDDQKAKVTSALSLNGDASEAIRSSMVIHLNRVLSQISTKNDLELNTLLKEMVSIIPVTGYDGGALLLKPLLVAGQAEKFASVAARVIKTLPYAPNKASVAYVIRQTLPEVKTVLERLSKLSTDLQSLRIMQTDNPAEVFGNLITKISEDPELLKSGLVSALILDLQQSFDDSDGVNKEVYERIQKDYLQRLDILSSNIRKGLQELDGIDTALRDAYAYEKKCAAQPCMLPQDL